MKKSKKSQTPDRDGNIPRQVRMPPVLDEWLQKKAAERAPVQATVADQIRKIIAEAYEAEKSQDQAA